MAERVPLVRDPFGMHGPKNMIPIAAAPLIRKPKITAQAAIEESAVVVSDVSVCTAFASVAESEGAGSAYQPTATARISRAKIVDAIRMFTGSPSCHGTPMCIRYANPMNGAVRIRE